MNKDVVILLEDKEEIINNFIEWHEDSNQFVDLIICRTYEEYENNISNSEIKSRIKCIILDLSNNSEEDAKREFKASTYIGDMYKQNRIPIFIHSALLSDYHDISDKGTVFKIPKSNISAKTIGDSIELMHNTGFLNIFPFNGTLELKIMTEIHSAFTNQFKGDEIQQIIKSIQGSGDDNIKGRTEEVFERLAIRAVYQNFISNSPTNFPVKVNSIEHYYRRTNLDKFPLWTGDIFQSVKEENIEMVILATPRCNLANKNFEELLFCKIDAYNSQQVKDFQLPKGVENVRKNITDNSIGEKLRFLPKTPQFPGGFVNFIKILTLPLDEFSKRYSYQISLVDDLTNDIIRKLATYLLRGGISDTAYAEAQYYFTEPIPKSPVVSSTPS